MVFELLIFGLLLALPGLIYYFIVEESLGKAVIFSIILIPINLVASFIAAPLVDATLSNDLGISISVIVVIVLYYFVYWFALSIVEKHKDNKRDAFKIMATVFVISLAIAFIGIGAGADFVNIAMQVPLADMLIPQP